MKHLQKFNEITDYHNMDNYYEVEPGKWRPKGTLYEKEEYKLTAEDVLDIVHNFSGATIPIEEIIKELKPFKIK